MKYLFLLIILLSSCYQVPSERNEMCLNAIRAWGYSPAEGEFDYDPTILTVHVIIQTESTSPLEGYAQLHGDTMIIRSMDQKAFNHEFGHILGVPHVKYPSDLMYPESTGAIFPSPEDIIFAHVMTDPSSTKIKCDFT